MNLRAHTRLHKGGCLNIPHYRQTEVHMLRRHCFEDVPDVYTYLHKHGDTVMVERELTHEAYCKQLLIWHVLGLTIDSGNITALDAAGRKIIVITVFTVVERDSGYYN